MLGRCSGAVISITRAAMAMRFDTYAGIMFTGVHDGLANGYIHSTDMNPTIGVRYKF